MRRACAPRLRDRGFRTTAKGRFSIAVSLILLTGTVVEGAGLDLKRCADHGVEAELLCGSLRVAENPTSPEVEVRALQKAPKSERQNVTEIAYTDSNGEAEKAIATKSVDVVAGTPWLFAREGMCESVDVLFIDEAGQMSLANAVAVGTAGRNLVLLGDPGQLAQPSQGIHRPAQVAQRSSICSAKRRRYR